MPYASVGNAHGGSPRRYQKRLKGIGDPKGHARSVLEAFLALLEV